MYKGDTRIHTEEFKLSYYFFMEILSMKIIFALVLCWRWIMFARAINVWYIHLIRSILL